MGFCYKCELLAAGQGRGKARRRRSSSSSILYSGLLGAAPKGNPFTLKLGAGAGKQLVLPFVGEYLTTGGSTAATAATAAGYSLFSGYSSSPASPASIKLASQGTPYFGEIDLNSHYVNKELRHPLSKPRRKFPGYQVPPRGKLQLIIYNNEKTVNSLVLLPYDLTSLQPNSKMLVKFRTYKEVVYSPEIRLRKLTSEVEVKFVNYKDRKFYVFDKIRILFSSRSTYAKDYKLPLNLYDASTAATAGAAGAAGAANVAVSIQFNPKIPLLPTSVNNIVEKIASDPYPVDIDYYTARCPHCAALASVPPPAPTSAPAYPQSTH